VIEASEILGLDIGVKHTGIARASSIARLAQPLQTVSTDDTINTIQAFLGEHKLEAIVVGLPRNLKGQDTEQTAWIRGWVDDAKAKISTTFYWQDEALTSKQAELINKKHSIYDDHAISAAIILQNFLDSETDRTLA